MSYPSASCYPRNTYRMISISSFAVPTSLIVFSSGMDVWVCCAFRASARYCRLGLAEALSQNSMITQELVHFPNNDAECPAHPKFLHISFRIGYRTGDFGKIRVAREPSSKPENVVINSFPFVSSTKVFGFAPVRGISGTPKDSTTPTKLVSVSCTAKWNTLRSSGIPDQGSTPSFSQTFV